MLKVTGPFQRSDAQACVVLHNPGEQMLFRPMYEFVVNNSHSIKSFNYYKLLGHDIPSQSFRVCSAEPLLHHAHVAEGYQDP